MLIYQTSNWKITAINCSLRGSLRTQFPATRRRSWVFLHLCRIFYSLEKERKWNSSHCLLSIKNKNWQDDSRSCEGTCRDKKILIANVLFSHITPVSIGRFIDYACMRRRLMTSIRFRKKIPVTSKVSAFNVVEKFRWFPKLSIPSLCANWILCKYLIVGGNTNHFFLYL